MVLYNVSRKQTLFGWLHCVVQFLQSSRHILRSNEIIIPSNGLLDVELDLSFSMQVNFVTAFVSTNE